MSPCHGCGRSESKGVEPLKTPVLSSTSREEAQQCWLAKTFLCTFLPFWVMLRKQTPLRLTQKIRTAGSTVFRLRRTRVLCETRYWQSTALPSGQEAWRSSMPTNRPPFFLAQLLLRGRRWQTRKLLQRLRSRPSGYFQHQAFCSVYAALIRNFATVNNPVSALFKTAIKDVKGEAFQKQSQDIHNPASESAQ